MENFSDNNEKLSFNRGIREIAEFVFPMWKEELLSLCSGREAHQIANNCAVNVLARKEDAAYADAYADIKV